MCCYGRLFIFSAAELGGVFVKKIKKIICIFVVLFLLVSCASNTLTFKLENITKIELRDGSNGNTANTDFYDELLTE